MDSGCENSLTPSSDTPYLTANQVLQLITAAVLCEVQITELQVNIQSATGAALPRVNIQPLPDKAMTPLYILLPAADTVPQNGSQHHKMWNRFFISLGPEVTD